MEDHCEHCNCENRRKYCGLKKETYFKVLLILSLIFFIGISIIMLNKIMWECTSGWTDPEYAAFALLYSGFLLLYMVVVDVTLRPLQIMEVYLVWLYFCMRGCMRNIWNRLGLPAWSDIRLMFSMRRAISTTHPQQEISISDNESNGDKLPPLPPRNRNMVEISKNTMFQKLTSNVSQGASSSTAPEDESAYLSSSLSYSPHCSKQSAPSEKSPRSQRKKSLKRKNFKDLMSKANNLNVIHEENLDTQGSSAVELSFSSLTQISAADDETEQETSFTTKPHQSGAVEQDTGYVNVDENDKPEPTQRVHGVQAQAKRQAGDKQNNPDQTSGTISRTTKEQLSAIQNYFIQSLEQPSTSGLDSKYNPTSSADKLGFINAPFSKFGTMCKFKNVPLSILENTAQEQIFADVHSGSQGEVNESGIQCQSTASYIRLPESESQSRVFDMEGTERNEKSLHQSTALAELRDSLSQTKEESSAVTFSGSLEQSQLSDIQKNQGNPDQSAENYVRLPELENQLRAPDIRTEMKQTSPEESAIRNVQTSLQGQVSSMPEIQRMPTYHGQTSSAGPQRQGRISDVQRRRSSRKHTPIPIYRTSSQSESESQEERLNLQQPIQSCAQFSSAMSQIQTSGIGEVHESSTQEIRVQERTSSLRTSKTLEKLRNLQEASEVGCSEAISQARHIGGDHEQPLSADYARKRFRGKAERATAQKHGESLSIGSEGPFREWNIRTKRTEGSIEKTSPLYVCAIEAMENSSIQRQQIEASGKGYLPHSILSRSAATPTRSHVVTSPLSKIKMDEDKSRQLSSRDPSYLKETNKQHTERKETFLTLDMAAGGQGLSKDGTEDETEADSSEQSFRYDQSMNILDLSDIEVPLPPKDIKPSIDKGKSQNLERVICQSNTRIKRTEWSAASSQLSACARGGLESFNIRSKEIEVSEEGYLPRSTLSISKGTPTQTLVVTTSLKNIKDPENRIGQRSSINPLPLNETEKQESQRKEKFLTLDLATGGLVLSKDGAEDETEADSSQLSFMCDQPLDVLDLSHIEVPFPPPKDKKASKDKDERQN